MNKKIYHPGNHAESKEAEEEHHGVDGDEASNGDKDQPGGIHVET